MASSLGSLNPQHCNSVAAYEKVCHALGDIAGSEVKEAASNQALVKQAPEDPTQRIKDVSLKALAEQKSPKAHSQAIAHFITGFFKANIDNVAKSDIGSEQILNRLRVKFKGNATVEKAVDAALETINEVHLKQLTQILNHLNGKNPWQSKLSGSNTQKKSQCENILRELFAANPENLTKALTYFYAQMKVSKGDVVPPSSLERLLTEQLLNLKTSKSILSEQSRSFFNSLSPSRSHSQESKMKGERAGFENDPGVKTMLGACCLAGFGTQKDIKHGIELIETAAKEGYAPALSILGNLYLAGHGVHKDKQTGLRLLTTAAEKGSTTAKVSLGLLEWENAVKKMETFSKEKSKKVAFPEMINFFSEAAREGHPIAQYYLGLCYQKGIGVVVNTNKAIENFDAAAKQGQVRAQYHLGMLHLDNHNFKEAVKHLKSAADKFPAAQYEYGKCLFEGRGVAKDKAAGIAQIRKAAENNNGEAQNYLGGYYEEEAKNPGAAFQYYTEAAKQNHPFGLFNLGRCYQKGIGVQKSDILAYPYFKRAGELGHPEANAVAYKLQKQLGIEAPKKEKLEVPKTKQPDEPDIDALIERLDLDIPNVG